MSAHPTPVWKQQQMTLKNKILPILAALGIVLALLVALQTQKKRPPAQPVGLPAKAPFTSYIGGAGIVEASSNNISIGTSLPGLVKVVYVKVGDRLKQGDPLFLIDDRDLQAQQLVKEANRIHAQASINEAKALLEDARSQYALVKTATNSKAVSVDDIQKRRNAELLAQAKVESAGAAKEVADAELKATHLMIEQLTVRAPMACEVMQVNIRAGEYASTGVLATPLILLGNLDLLYVRVDIDENDAWRFKPETKAVASMRGNRDLKADLHFVRVEPFIVAKKSLTGSSTERVDTRVLQVLYSFPRQALPAYVGQQMDVFIEAPDISTTSVAVESRL
ncbi:efflux RND transporter periplasmic adaptor subunit [Desulfobulbus oligotrophicus]|nr:biotin/lipoyl-binding protein [Desulfobulbus oligotrophicus]